MLFKRIIPLALLAVSLVACGTTTQAPAAPVATAAPATVAPTVAVPVKIGLITKTETNPFFVKMKEGAQAEAKAKGAELLTAAGKFDGDNEGQVTAIENMINAGVKGILLVPNQPQAIVPTIKKAQAAGVLVIALDTPVDAADALFATNNFKAGQLIGQYAKAALGTKTPKIIAIDLAPGISVGILRHNGFMNGIGVDTAVDDKAADNVNPAEVVCHNDGGGDTAKSQTAMENCLQKSTDVNVVYTINEPAAYGAYNALKAVGKEMDAIIVSVDGSCQAMQAMKEGKIAATSQQYPLKMASMGVDAVVDYATTGKKVSGYTDTGVALITDHPQAGVDSISIDEGTKICWGTVS